MRTHAPTVLYSEHLEAALSQHDTANSRKVSRYRTSGGGRMDESAVRWPRIFVAVATIHLLQLLRFVLAWLLAVVMV